MSTRRCLGTMVRICSEHITGLGYSRLVVLVVLVVVVKSDKQRL